VRKFIIVLTYDVIMKLRTSCTSRYYILFDIPERGTALYIYTHTHIYALYCVLNLAIFTCYYLMMAIDCWNMQRENQTWICFACASSCFVNSKKRNTLHRRYNINIITAAGFASVLTVL